MDILCPPGGQDRENRPGGYPEQGRGCEPQPAALVEPDHAEGHVSQHGTDQQRGQDPDSPLLEDADHGNFASEPTTISVRPRFAYSLLAILDPAQTAGSWGTELVPTRNRDDATISMESGQEPPPGSLTDVDQRLLEYCPRGPGRRARVGRILFLAGIRDPPDGTRAVVSHKQRAVRRHGHTDRTAPDVSFLGDETDQEVFVLSCRLAVFHWHEDHFVARPAGTIPRAMLGSKRVQPVLLRELTAVIEGQIERRRVRLNENVGNNHLVLEFRVFSLVPGVLIRPKVVPWPAVETAFLDVGDIVGHEIVTQPVALVSRSPELPGPGMNRQAHGIANARGEGPLVLAVRVEGENHSAALFGMDILRPPGGQDRENRPGGYPEQGRGCEPQPAALIEPHRAEGHVSQHGTDQQHGQDPDSPLLENADHGDFASEPTTISARPPFRLRSSCNSRSSPDCRILGDRARSHQESRRCHDLPWKADRNLRRVR